MFEKSLLADLKTIFDLPKVTLDAASESHEQECMFVKIDKVNSSLKDKRQIARVHGTLVIYCNSDKMPFGYFIKQSQKSALSSKFFFGPEQHVANYVNISQRSMDFVYLYDSEFNPSVGLITSVDENITYQVGS